jgi:hypothetical protein
MSYSWSSCVFYFAFTLIAASSAIRNRCTQFCRLRIPLIHALITSDLGVEKVSSHV